MNAQKNRTFGDLLIESAREAVGIERGKVAPARVSTYDPSVGAG